MTNAKILIKRLPSFSVPNGNPTNVTQYKVEVNMVKPEKSDEKMFVPLKENNNWSYYRDSTNVYMPYLILGTATPTPKIS